MTSPDDGLVQLLRQELTDVTAGVRPGWSGLDAIQAKINGRPPRPWLFSLLAGWADRVRYWTWRGHWAWPEFTRTAPAVRDRRPAAGSSAHARHRGPGLDGWLRPVALLGAVAVIVGVSFGVQPFRQAVIQASTAVINGVTGSTSGAGGTDANGSQPGGGGPQPGGGSGPSASQPAIAGGAGPAATPSISVIAGATTGAECQQAGGIPQPQESGTAAAATPTGPTTCVKVVAAPSGTATASPTTSPSAYFTVPPVATSAPTTPAPVWSRPHWSPTPRQSPPTTPPSSGDSGSPAPTSTDSGGGSPAPTSTDSGGDSSPAPTSTDSGDSGSATPDTSGGGSSS